VIRAFISDAIAAKLNPSLSGANSLIYSTYLGGSDSEYGYAIALDSSGTAFLTGKTDSTNFPTQQPLQARAGLTDAFLTALQWNATTSQLSYGYSTVLGGAEDDAANGIALDSAGNAVVVGSTTSPDFPLGARDPIGGLGDLVPIAFVAKLTAATTPGTRTLAYSYDGLLRLTSAIERPGASYDYIYDKAGNRTWAQVNGGTPTTFSYNAANQITNAPYSYDLAGNLLTDGTATYTYDALNRAKTVAGAQSRTYP
jgi:Beta-propeller repeat